MEARLEPAESPLLPRIAPVKLLLGLFIAVLGVVMTLDNLALIDAGRVLRFWPLVLVAVGVVEIVRSGNRPVGVLLVAAGTLLTLIVNRWLRFSLLDLWPLLVIGAGIVTIMQALGMRPIPNSLTPAGSGIWSILSNRKVVEQSRDYTGGRIVAFMGGCHLDLTEADIQRSPAVIDVVAVWGGIEIRVPERWQVSAEAVPFMGGLEIRTKGSSSERRLVIRGLIWMAGMDVKSVAGRTQ